MQFRQSRKHRALCALVVGFPLVLLSAGAWADDSLNAKPHVDSSQPTNVYYPEVSQRAGEEGTIVLNVYVLESGKPRDISVMKSSGFDDLDTAAVQTAANWHYVPAIREGNTAPGWTTVQIVYKLPQNAQK